MNDFRFAIRQRLRPLHGLVGVLGQRAPHFDRAMGRVQRAGETGQDAIAHGLEDATVARFHFLGHHGGEIGDVRSRSFFVGFHHGGIADDITGQDRGKTAFHWE